MRVRLRIASVAAAALLLGACGGDDAEVLRPYDRAPVPGVPDRTQPIEPAWVDSQIGLVDGQYWAEDAVADADRIVFTVVQVFFGPACEEELGAENCMNDYGILDEPTGDLATDPAALRIVSVAAEDQRNFSVPGAELMRLVSGEAPTGAPVDYEYTPFPFLLTVSGGAVVEARQIWVP
ncbi:MAG: hypothetical protein RI900_1425 [Actinomycetota bacterium]